MSKVCTVCKEDKPLDQFHKQQKTKDGRQSLCKRCNRENTMKHRNLYKSGEKEFQCYPVYPLNIQSREWQCGKYLGSISYFSYINGTPYVQATFNLKEKVKTKNFVFNDTNKEEKIQEAQNWLWQQTFENKLLKNRIRVLDENTIEVELSKGQVMTTDIQFSDLCQKYRINTAYKKDSKGDFYATIFCEEGDVRFHRKITGFQMVDHINRIPLDNRLVNLREATFKTNNNNVSMHKNNTSGYTGVRRVDNRWIARIECDGKNHSKSFSIKQYDEEEAKRLAIEHRIALCKQFGNNNQLSKDIPNFIEQ